MFHGVFRAFGPASLLFAGAVFPLLLTACASRGIGLQEPCRVMQAQVREKQKLDAQITGLSKQEEKFRKQNDTASAASAEHRLKGLRENQRLLKESLEQSSRDCSPTWQDPVPVRDPARRDHQENR